VKPEEDRTLLDAAVRGDRKALEALLARHQAQIYRFGLRMCRDPDLAQDVLQNTLLTAARGLRDFRGGASLSTWLYAIARRFCGKLRRKASTTRERERALDAQEMGRAVDAAERPDEALEGKEVRGAIEDAIASLEPMYREVFVLRDLEGLTAAEVAEVVGASEQAVKSRLHRARLAVRAHVAPLLRIEPIESSTTSGPGCPDVLRLYSRHLEGEISADVCAQMERHLTTCAHCRGTCDSLKRTLALCKAAPAPEVPPAVQDSVRSALRALLPDR
jgi:RNA polymerase sigma-70 factor (ECF subfamily)